MDIKSFKDGVIWFLLSILLYINIQVVCNNINNVLVGYILCTFLYGLSGIDVYRRLDKDYKYGGILQFSLSVINSVLAYIVYLLIYRSKLW